jgi:ribonuclease BN (tRNA processing enzyme)
MARIELRTNGIYSAWMAEFGHQCPHCDEIRDSDPYRIANVSWSLIQRDNDGRLLRHTLLDIGLGVMQSLLDFERSHDVHVVHEVLLSHSHFDHVGHLDWLSSAIRRNNRPEQPRPLPVYCTQRCWEIGPARLFPWLVNKAVRHEPIEPGRPIDLGAARITPLAVEHGSTAPGAVGFAIECRTQWSGPRAPGPGPGPASPRSASATETSPSDSRPLKIVMTCDLTRPVEPSDPNWHGADVLFIEANTWNRNPDTGHQSIQDALELVHRWRPKRTYLVHYSGYEDARYPHGEVSGPLTHDNLMRVVRRHAGDFDIRMARHGAILPLDDPWP